MLPNMKYNGGASRGQSIVFKGLNLSDTATEGELIACTNLSARRFPHLSARSGRTRKGKYDKATAAFMWNGHEIVAEGGKLLYDGVALCNCNAEPKQFAVVNTKLVVWPDKLVIDMTDKSFKKLDVAVTNNGEASVKYDSISFVPRSVYATLLHEATGTFRNDGVYIPYFWSYENVEWSENTGWKLSGGELRPMHECVGRYYIPDVVLNGDTGEFVIALPHSAFPKEYGGTVTSEELPEPVGNTEGFYCEITKQTRRFVSGPIGAEKYLYSQSVSAYWSVEDNNYKIEDCFESGDTVNVSNSTYGIIDAKGLTVESVEAEQNTVAFKQGNLAPVKYVYELPENILNNGDTPEIEIHLLCESDYIVHAVFEAEVLPEGNVICIETEAPSLSESVELGEHGFSVFLWDPATKTRCNAERYNAYHVDEDGDDESYPKMEVYDVGRLTVQRVAYDFDYICEKDNRLWGVCNRQKDSSDGARGRLIFASALGDPTEFDKFEGLSTDSWQAAIAGDGDFTACCNYGDCVLFFKEDKIYKVAGDLPEQYTLYPYNVAGVQEGSYKSLVNINETLLYKGVNGVYAYGGAVPSLVSSALGRKKYYDACAGSDGIVYYISMRDETGYHLFTYDTLAGLWLREDDTAAADFCFSTGDLLMLTGGKLYLINGEADTDDGTPIEWSAELASFNEATDHNRRSYSRLLLRTSKKNLKTDSVRVYVSNTSGRWDPCTKNNLSVGDYVIPLKPNRDNDLRIKIEGKSPDMVLSLAREYIGGSELGGVK